MAKVDVRVADTPLANDQLAVTTNLPLPARENPTGGTFERRGIQAWQRKVDGRTVTYFFAHGEAATRLRNLLAGAGTKMFDDLIEALRQTAFDDESSGITVAKKAFEINPDNDPNNIAGILASAWDYVSGPHTADDDRADAEDRAAAAEGDEIVETDTRD